MVGLDSEPAACLSLNLLCGCLMKDDSVNQIESSSGACSLTDSLTIQQQGISSCSMNYKMIQLPTTPFSPGSHYFLDSDDSSSDGCVTPPTADGAMMLASHREVGKDKSHKPYLPTLSIATTPKTVNRITVGNRFTDAQRGRTLCHHRMLQPTPSQERTHLSKLRANENAHVRTLSSQTLHSLPEEEDALVHLDLKHMQIKESWSSTRRNSNTSGETSSTRMSPYSSDSSMYREEESVEDETDFQPPEPRSPLKMSAYDVVRTSFDMSMFSYCQPCSEMEIHSSSHRFVICADTQFGVGTNNDTWHTEMEYSIEAVKSINNMDPPPAFVCVCGDLVDMEFSFEKNKGFRSKFPSTLFNSETGIASREVCDFIQDEQNADFKRIWAGLDPNIALVCLCGNHDVGNRPTPRSISRFRAAFGDEYLAFWTNGSYNIVLNNVIYVDPSGAERIFNTQHRWLENRLQYAKDHHATNIFVFAHHPWFLYDELETPDDLTGYSLYPDEWQPNDGIFPDSYFSMPPRYRAKALKVFRQYNVKACFSGHFHQNLVSKTSWGMDMIVTSSLSVVFDSTGKQKIMSSKIIKSKEDEEEKALLEAQCPHRRTRKMTCESEEAMISCVSEDERTLVEPNCRGIRVVDVPSDGNFRHFFVPL